ncbi:MAG TPA: enoyl-ACP reductase FabV [Gammaproteobacteria bacterium]|nr:enoyl-ACP reductase FabV [Gammaproteobacteria bacterium]
MIVEPKVWGFICTTAHPTGCAAHVREQIRAVRQTGGQSARGTKRALIIGASTGYGLAARITAAFGYGAETLGVFFEKPGRGARTASAGWYNAAAFAAEAEAAGLRHWSLNGDAFSDAARARAIEIILHDMGGPVDLVIYSLAAPARRMPDTGTLAQTALKPIGRAFRGRTIDTDRDCLTELVLEPASEQEISDTVVVMGGDDWARWMHALKDAGALAADATTVAFSYLGPEITRPIYRDGTIGRAKAHLEQTAAALRASGVDARIAVLKSIVTQASAAIPLIPLYLSLVFKVMKEQGLHEGALEQQQRLFRDFLYRADGAPATLDEAGRLRLDERELGENVQQACQTLWPGITDDTLMSLTDYAGYKQDFLRLFGFGFAGVDYAAEVETQITIAGCTNV